MKPRQKKTKVKKAMEEVTGRRCIEPLEDLGDMFVEYIKTNRDHYNLSNRGCETSRRLYEQSKPFNVRDIDLYI